MLRPDSVVETVMPSIAGSRSSAASVVDGARHPRLAREVRTEGERALALLEAGLGGYAVKDPGTTLPG
jgi:hypothetical protein